MSQIKSINKKNIFKEGSNPLFPISSKNLNSLNYYSAVNIKNDTNKHKKKLLSTDIQRKKVIDNNSSAIKNCKEINKTYSSTRSKEELIKIYSNSKIAKIKPLEIISNLNNSQILEKNKNRNAQKKSLLSANKINNRTNINMEIDASKFFKNNLNIISPKNLGSSQNFNINNRNNNNIFSLRKPNINKNIIQITNSNNNSYYNNIIINDNSSSNIKDKSSGHNYYLLTEKNRAYTKSPKESNVKLIFTNTKLIHKKLDNNEGTIILKKKESSSLPLTYINPGKKANSSLDNKMIKEEYKLHLKKAKKINSNEKNIINDNINNYVNNMKNNYNPRKDMIQGPEDLHFYYILVLQDGKKTETHFEKDN